MLAVERLLEIEDLCRERVARIVVGELDGETLRLILYLHDGSNLRVTEPMARPNARTVQLLLADGRARFTDRMGQCSAPYAHFDAPAP